LMDDNKNVKIIDFGLSNLFDGESYLTTFCGSPKYAAPEIITGTKYIGPSVDIWSLGVILFAALTGKLPFNAKTFEATYAKVLTGVIKYPDHLSKPCKDYIGRFLTLDINDRIKMPEAFNHPWILEGFGSPPESHLPARPQTVPEPLNDVFSQVLEYGYTEKEARLALQDVHPNPIKNTYFLLLEKKIREQKNSGESSRERFSLSSLLTHTLKSKKNKFDKDGFLLDVTYITDQLIRLSQPVEKVESLFMNPIKEVQQFFEKYHKDNFRLYNLCPNNYQAYSSEKFNNAVVRFPVPDESLPTLQTLNEICKDIEHYLDKSTEKVVAIHGKQDQLRPALVICAYLLHTHVLDTADEALGYYVEKLFPTEENIPKNLFNPSMRRYLTYYQSFRDNDFKFPPEKLYCISTIELNSIPTFDVYGGCDPFVKIKMNGPVMVNIKKTEPIRHYSTKKDSSVKLSCFTVPMSNDIYIAVLDRDPLYAEVMFSICLNFSYLESHSNIIPGEVNPEIDEEDLEEFVVVEDVNPSKVPSVSSKFSIVFTKNDLDIDKKVLDKFGDNFAVTITFTEPNIAQNNNETEAQSKGSFSSTSFN